VAIVLVSDGRVNVQASPSTILDSNLREIFPQSAPDATLFQAHDSRADIVAINDKLKPPRIFAPQGSLLVERS